MKWQAMKEAAGTYEYRVWLQQIYRPKFHEIRKKIRDTFGKEISKQMDWLQYGNHFGIDPEMAMQVAPEWGGHTGVDADITWIPTVTIERMARDEIATRSRTRQKEKKNKNQECKFAFQYYYCA